MRRRVFVALIVGTASFVLSMAYRVYVKDASGDLVFPVCAAHALVSGVDPYGGACRIVWHGVTYPPNPLTTVLVTVPFLPLWPAAASLMWGIGSGLLAYGLVKDGQWWRLLLFTSAAYWVAFQWMQ